MQFKKRGNKIQVLAYEGYDKEKRRSIVKAKGTLCAYTFKPSEGLIDNLTDKQKEELQSYINNERQKERKNRLQYTASSIDSYINKATEALEQSLYQLNEAKALNIYEAMDRLKKAMRKQGFSRKAVKQQQQ